MLFDTPRHKRICASLCSFKCGGWAARPAAGHKMAAGRKKEPYQKVWFFFSNRQLSILPGRFQPSTFDVWGLNYCVRDGNRWIPLAITTGLFNWGLYPQNFNRRISLTLGLLLKSSPRHISIGPLNTLLYLHSRPINLVFSKVSY